MIVCHALVRHGALDVTAGHDKAWEARGEAKKLGFGHCHPIRMHHLSFLQKIAYLSILNVSEECVAKFSAMHLGQPALDEAVACP